MQNSKTNMEAPLGLIGIWDIQVKIYRDTGCLVEKMYGIRNIRKTDSEIPYIKLKGYKPQELTGHGICRPKINGISNTQTPLMGPQCACRKLSEKWLC